MVVHGVDASNNNATVNWKKVKADGCKFAWLKVTEGSSFVDAFYDLHYKNAKAVGLQVGGYHFARASNDPVKEAQFFLNHLGLKRGDQLPALDIEVDDGLTPSNLIKWAQTWLDTVQKKIGAKPVVYTYQAFLPNLGTLPSRYPLWIASYGAKRPPSKWMAWQFTDKGKSGLDESVCVNLAALTYKPTLKKKVVKVVKKPTHPLARKLAPNTAYRLLNPSKCICGGKCSCR